MIRDRDRSGWVFGFLLAFSILLSSGHLHLTDEEQTLRAADNLRHGVFTIPHSHDPGGHYVYGITTLIVTALVRLTVPSWCPCPEFRTLLVSFLAFAFAGYFFHRAGLFLGLTPRRSAAAVILLTVGSNYAVWADSIKDEVFLVAFLAAFAYYLLEYSRRPSARALGLLALCYGCAILTKSAFAVTLPLVVIWLWRRVSGPARYRALALILVCLLIVMANNWVRFGRLASGYAATLPTGQPLDLSFPLLTGLAGHLFSPLRSVFLYNPFLVIALTGAARLKRYPPGGLLLAACGFAYLLLVSKWTGWEGEVGFGNRLALPAVFLFAPFLLVAVRDLSWRPLVPLVLLAGLLVNLPGHLVDVATYYQNPDRVRELVTIVRDAPFDPVAWRQQNELTVLALRNLIVNLGEFDLARLDREQPRTSQLDRLEYYFWGGQLDLWFVYCYYRAIPLRLLILAGGLLSAGALVCLVMLFRPAPHEAV